MPASARRRAPTAAASTGTEDRCWTVRPWTEEEALGGAVYPFTSTPCNIQTQGSGSTITSTDSSIRFTSTGADVRSLVRPSPSKNLPELIRMHPPMLWAWGQGSAKQDGTGAGSDPYQPPPLSGRRSEGLGFHAAVRGCGIFPCLPKKNPRTKLNPNLNP